MRSKDRLDRIDEKSKRKANRRERTLVDIRSRMGRFCAGYGSTPVHEITTPMIERWLDNRGYRGVSQDNYRRYFVGFFNFAVNEGVAKVGIPHRSGHQPGPVAASPPPRTGTCPLLPPLVR